MGERHEGNQGALLLGGAVRRPAVTVPAGKPAAAPRASAVVRPTRHGRRPWLIVPLVLLAIVLLVGGYYALRVRHVFETVNSVSTPASVIRGDALGGSGDVTIDTGPAQTAIASGESSSVIQPANADETAGAADVSAALLAAPAQGAAQRGATLPDPPAAKLQEAPATPAADTTPEGDKVVLSELERIKNGSFEQGDKGWYLEDAAAIVGDQARTGASSLQLGPRAAYADQGIFFIAGTTYQVTAWGKLSEEGATANFGVIYFDADGNRLTDLEPQPQQFTDNRWRKITFSVTPPEAAATVKVFFWKPDTPALFWVDDVSARSVVPADQANASAGELPQGVMTILVMGVDARPGEAIDIGVRPDSLAVVQLNSETGSCRLLAIPRDTRTELPGYGLSKVNHALAVGGIEYQMQVVEKLLDLKLDHYVLIDFDGFKDLVDAVGGITVDVPEDFTASDGTVFLAGRQEMTGKQALSYARWRGGPDGDFGRIQRQQQILRALVRKATGLNIVRSVNELLPAVEQNLRTDFSPTDMISIGRDFQSRCTEETVSMLSLEGSIATYDDPLLQMPLSYVEVDEAEIRRKVAALLEP